jgi:hypothetical protein
VGGRVSVEFTNSPLSYQVCRLAGEETWAIVDGDKVDFDLPSGVDLSQYYIISKLKEENGQAQGKKRGFDTERTRRLLKDFVQQHSLPSNHEECSSQNANAPDFVHNNENWGQLFL